MSMPRPEYPRPQFRREAWMNLNGVWQFEIDNGCSGEARGLLSCPLSGQIVVPFCPESALSGVGEHDFMRCVWYRRFLTLPESARGKRLLLHFGAADYRTRVWVNGALAGTHEGGYASFCFDITALTREGENELTVCCEDDAASPLQPSGKQSARYESHGCYYTRTTGIWQTVWLEWVEKAYMKQIFLTPDPDNGCLHIRCVTEGAAGECLRAQASLHGEPAGTGEAVVAGNEARLTVPLSPLALWEVGSPELYDLTLTLGHDRVESYFGLRSVRLENGRFLLNGHPVFLRLVLDQGFYPDGVCTAPDDAALRRDIELAQAMGFNGARLHQKVFEARYLYWADRLGYLCWGEMGSWGLDHSRLDAFSAFAGEWLDVVARDYSAPSVIGWCPFNETWDVDGRRQDDHVLALAYRLTKALDQTRPVIDTSGNYHVLTDIYDVHDYEQDPVEFAARYGRGTKPIFERFPTRQQPGGQPVFVSEYGGILWREDESGEGWGYGQGPESKTAFLARYEALTRTLMDNPDHIGLCYTQLTDVEQEQNGLYTYDRHPKFDPAAIRAINARPAACERETETP